MIQPLQRGDGAREAIDSSTTAMDQKDFNHTDVNYHATGMELNFIKKDNNL